MRTLYTVALSLVFTIHANSETRTVHVFVALCDNENQGIVPVPESLGNGQDPKNNLYWGAAFGIRSFFKHKTADWVLVEELQSQNALILDRVLFKHSSKDVYMLAEAYDGKYIKTCTEDFLLAANRQGAMSIDHKDQKLSFGGQSDLVCYIGHDGLMEFSVSLEYESPKADPPDAIILACFSKSYFSEHIESSGAHPLLWTTHLMAPEAYSLKAALDGWMIDESDDEVVERAAQAYNKYQKCGIKGARNLFTSGH